MQGSVGFDAKLGVGRVGSLRLLGIWSSGRPTEFTEMGPRIPGPDPELETVDPDLISSGAIDFLDKKKNAPPAPE